MGKVRLEAFSDGVIAVIITIMVLELKVPHGAAPEDLVAVAPTFLSYVLSFVYVAIYWNNHHHMLSTVKKVSGTLLWANLHLLFWLSLVPFATAWIAEHPLSAWPTALYGVILVMAAVAYTVEQYEVICLHGKESLLATAVGRDVKGKVSIASYLLALAAAFYLPAISTLLYVFVACLWVVPDRRIERLLRSGEPDAGPAEA